MEEKRRLKRLHADRMTRYRQKKKLREWGLMEKQENGGGEGAANRDSEGGNDDEDVDGGVDDDDNDHHHYESPVRGGQGEVLREDMQELLRDDSNDNHSLELAASPVQALSPLASPLASPGVMETDMENEELFVDEEMGEEEEEEEEEVAEGEVVAEERPDADAGEDAWLHAPGRLQDGNDAVFKNEVGDFFASITAGGSCTKTAAQTIFQFCAKHAEDFVRAKRRGIRMKSLQHLLDRTYMRVSPAVVTDLFMMQDGVQVRIASVEVYTKRLQEMKVVKRTSMVSLQEIFSYVYRKHGVDERDPPQEWREIDFFSDGITWTTKGSWTHHVAAISFVQCGKPMPYQLHQFNPSVGGKVTVHNLLSLFVQELREMPFRVRLRWTIGDGKERKFVKGLISTNASFGCDYCYARGRHLPWDEKRNRMSFPPRDAPAQPRTEMDCRRCMHRQNERFIIGGARDDFKWRRMRGIICYSPLLDVGEFDVIKDGPPDSMHLIALGLGKDISLGILGLNKENAESIQRLHAFNRFVEKIKLPTELGRRTRAYCSNYKACEWRFVCKFCFPWIADSDLCPDEVDKEILLTFSFLYRALDLNETDFARLQDRGVEIAEVLGRLQDLYEQRFGAEEFTYNEHIYFGHIIQARMNHGPLYKYSAWRYERLCGDMKDSFRPGTPHEGKQILQRTFAADHYHHSCHGDRKIRYDSQAADKRDDSIVCMGGNFFRVLGISGDGRSVRCNKIRTAGLHSGGLDWESVFVRKIDDDETERRRITIDVDDITGKGVIVGNLIMECKKEWLLE